MAPETSADTLFGGLTSGLQSRGLDRRALAGRREGVDWVELTGAQLLAEVAAVSTRLAELGLRAGDVLCLQLPNGLEAVVYTYAAARIGAVVCPLTTIYRRRELGHVLRRTRCTILVVPSRHRRFDHAGLAATLLGEVSTLQHVICVGETAHAGLLGSAVLREPLSGAPTPVTPTGLDDPAVLAFTSGTTGEPKGVMHSAASMHAAVDGFVGHAGFGEGLRSLVVSPFGHLTGFTWGIVMPLRGGGEVVLQESWDAEEALDLTARYDVSFSMGATPFLTDLLAAAGRPGARLPAVFVCAGAPIPPVLVERAVARHGCRVVAGWGMSEYPIGTSTAVGDDPSLAGTSDGRPAGPAQVRVVDEHGDPVAVGAEGDLQIRGPGLTIGYYERPDLDAAARTVDGFLMTGDRAKVVDARGHIRISGRTKDIIIRGGENIPVVDVENVLLTHPAVREVALVPVPHERLGETACACLVLVPGTAAPTVAELGAFLAGEGVAVQFWPESLRVLDELPRTPSGKIQKFALRRVAPPGVPG
ncbi:AMP-binding protein [Modestobacter sp. Leaf380]|uniref:AMP-binding protein n=1 Tax=Modestobacter sp. Leaf380 TaxID=1736356 RepID=UPI000700341C|nr:AMP-binding protein [Modestobacter sp. Leaf380]KQS64265.1 hypothetical protein ASG41_16480 [Modestobacter sp. Leaf380]